MSSGKRTSLVALFTLALLFVFRAHLHMDVTHYSANFADQETHLGLPNFWNVVTNLGFLGLGLIGLKRLERFPSGYRLLAAIFSIAVLGTAFGSSYFHYAPSPERLFWDQLPMSVGFASFVGIVVADRVHTKLGVRLGVALCVLGAISVWNMYFGTGATEYYLGLQFGSLIFAILTLAATKGNQLDPRLVFLGLAAYIAAKVFEGFDAQIFEALKVMSGHSLKHVAAALAIWAILRGSEAKA